LEALVIFKTLLATTILFSINCLADQNTPYTLQIANNQVAQASLNIGGEPHYLQDGALVAQDKVVYGKPYCMVFGTNFRPDPAQIYPVALIQNSSDHNPPLYVMNLKLDTQAPDSFRTFMVNCVGVAEVTMSDVKAALNQVYVIKP
jgi:hypothetical protein